MPLAVFYGGADGLPAGSHGLVDGLQGETLAGGSPRGSGIGAQSLGKAFATEAETISSPIQSVFQNVFQGRAAAEVLEYQIPEDNQGAEGPLVEHFASQPKRQRVPWKKSQELLLEALEGKTGA